MIKGIRIIYPLGAIANVLEEVIVVNFEHQILK